MPDPELPVMSDEQIDVMWMRLNNEDRVNRGRGWRHLRAAFPAPRPPRPQGQWFFVDAEEGIQGNRIRIPARHAAAALAELQACVDWIADYEKETT